MQFWGDDIFVVQRYAMRNGSPAPRYCVKACFSEKMYPIHTPESTREDTVGTQLEPAFHSDCAIVALAYVVQRLASCAEGLRSFPRTKRRQRTSVFGRFVSGDARAGVRGSDFPLPDLPAGR